LTIIGISYKKIACSFSYISKLPLIKKYPKRVEIYFGAFFSLEPLCVVALVWFFRPPPLFSQPQTIGQSEQMKTLDSIRYEVAPVQGGYTDQILRLDLTSLTISTIDVEPDYRRKYVGGRGYAIKMIWDGTSKETRYDSPENILVMASGPLGNEPRFPGTGKFVVGTISPLTDTFIDSNIGGHC
jgi:hypothetical protein